jgi:hypothetical protein
VIADAAADGLIDGCGIQQPQQLVLLHNAARRELAIEHDIFLAPRYLFGNCQIVRVQARSADDDELRLAGGFAGRPQNVINLLLLH